MNTNMPKNAKILKGANSTKNKFKTIYSLRVKLKLQEFGFEPLLEADNIYKPPFKCWVFLETPEFSRALTEILTGGHRHG